MVPAMVPVMHRLALATVGLLLLPSAAAQAEALRSAARPPQPIYGGTEVEPCGWPTTVFMDGCTGTLVHPELVVFASHCMFFAGGSGPEVVGFGESAQDLTREVATSSCTMYPGWVPDESGLGFDVAFCVLAEPVFDVPIVPILMGCETDVLQPGQEITLVGYGVTDDNVFGTKYEVVTTVNALEGETEINVGGNGTSSCNGDSGGPAYVQLDDGSWRAFGITSRGVSGNCADPSIYGLMHSHVPWIEEASGIDISPCHDADGSWNPSDACTEIPLTPDLGFTDWPAGCNGGRLSGPSASCGDPFVEGGTGTTGEADTGLDDTAGSSSSDTGLPGGTAAESSSTTTGSSTDDLPPAANEDTGCSCQSTPSRPSPLPLLLLIPLARRRQRSK